MRLCSVLHWNLRICNSWRECLCSALFLILTRVFTTSPEVIRTSTEVFESLQKFSCHVLPLYFQFIFLLCLYSSFCLAPSSCCLLWPLFCFYDRTPFSFRNVFRIRFVLVQEVSILLHSRLRLDGSRPNRAANEFCNLTYTLCVVNLIDEIKFHSSYISTKYSTCTEKKNRKAWSLVIFTGKLKKKSM